MEPFYSGKEIYLFDEFILKKIVDLEFDKSIEDIFESNLKRVNEYLPFNNVILAFDNPYNKNSVISLQFQKEDKLYLTGYFDNYTIMKTEIPDNITLKNIFEIASNNKISNEKEIKKLLIKLFAYIVLELPELDMQNLANNKSKKFKEKRREELFTLYKNKEYGYTLKKLIPIDGYCICRETLSEFKIIRSGFHRKIITVPSAMYPVPNNKMKPRLFLPDNTEEFRDSTVNDALTDMEFLPGRCYTNANKIIDKLGKEYKFYSGWVFIYGQPIHHAWVVKNNSIIDVANTRKDIQINPDVMLEKQEYAKMFYEYYKEDLPFRDKYPYGKVTWNKIYIGVESNYKEAIYSFNNLMEKYPEHPDYLNINKKTGCNETLKYMYQQIEKQKINQR